MQLCRQSRRCLFCVIITCWLDATRCGEQSLGLASSDRPYDSYSVLPREKEKSPRICICSFFILSEVFPGFDKSQKCRLSGMPSSALLILARLLLVQNYFFSLPPCCPGNLAVSAVNTSSSAWACTAACTGLFLPVMMPWHQPARYPQTGTASYSIPTSNATFSCLQLTQRKLPLNKKKINHI